MNLGYCVNLTSLPKGLEVKGNLWVYETTINSLPKGLEVGWDLNLSFCANLTSLPEGLKVGGDLIIRDTPLKKYRDKELRDMVKPGFIKGDIYR